MKKVKLQNKLSRINEMEKVTKIPNDGKTAHRERPD